MIIIYFIVLYFILVDSSLSMQTTASNNSFNSDGGK